MLVETEPPVINSFHIFQRKQKCYILFNDLEMKECRKLEMWWTLFDATWLAAKSLTTRDYVYNHWYSSIYLSQLET